MRLWGVLGYLLLAGVVSGQTLDNKTLSGKYFFRHLSLTTDNLENITETRSLWGAIQFDADGNYGFTGLSAAGATPPVAATGHGTYAVDAGGMVTLTNPQNNQLTLNARWGEVTLPKQTIFGLVPGEGILLGSSTEGTSNTFDLFVAIQGAPAVNTSLSGNYFVSSLGFPSGSGSQVESAWFSLQPDGQGHFADVSASGHGAGVEAGALTSQTLTGATYSVQSDGTGSALFPLQSGLTGATQLFSGHKTIYVSAKNNVILGGSDDGTSQDLFVALRATVAGQTWNQKFFWHAGLRFEPGGLASSYTGSLYTNGSGTFTFTRRLHQLQQAGAITYDFTGANVYSLGPDGTGTAELTKIGMGGTGNAFAGAAIHAADRSGYELYLGVQMPAVSGPGVFLNPQQVVNGASFAPAGNPIAPGELVTLSGTNLAGVTQKAPAPYPPSLAGVTVLINNIQAPVSYVSAAQINVMVPYATSGPTATIVVHNNGSASNIVEVPVRATAPGIFSMNNNGIGPGAITHADFSLVNAGKPATRGETVSIFLTGLGAVAPGVADGTAGGTSPLSRVTANVLAIVGGVPATVTYAGLSPGLPGVYQINIVVPEDLNVTATGPFPLAIETADSFHDQVDLVVSP